MLFSPVVLVPEGVSNCAGHPLQNSSRAPAPQPMAAAAPTAAVTNAVSKWSVEEVGAWLRLVELGTLCPLFEQSAIDGAVLLTLSESDLKDLGVVVFGQRRRLLIAIDALKHATPPVAAPAADGLPSEQQGTVAAAAAVAAAVPSTQTKKATAGFIERFTARDSTVTTPLDLDKLYPPGYVAPSLSQALQDAGVPEAEAVARLCLDVAQRAEANGALCRTRLKSASGAAFVIAYSFDFGAGSDRERNPYRLLNSALIERNALQLGRVRGFLFGLLSALRSLPRFTAPVLYRGIRERIAMNSGHYYAGNTVTWHSFSSTTPDVAVTKSFLTGAASGKCEGTLFILHNAWGYDLQPFSIFEEHEVLLEPEVQLRVMSVLDAPLIVVEAEMVPGKLLLEQLIPPSPVQPPAAQPAPGCALRISCFLYHIPRLTACFVMQSTLRLRSRMVSKESAESSRR